MSNPFHEPSNPYAAPTTDFNDLTIPSHLVVSAKVILALKQTRPWALCLGIMGIIGSLLMFCVSGFVFFVPMPTPAQMPHKGAVGIFYLVMAIGSIVPSILLIRYSQKISDLIAAPNTRRLEDALEAQKSFWRFVGIMVTLLVLFNVVLFIGAIVYGAIVQTV